MRSIRDAAGAGLDWERLALITSRHRVEGLVNHALAEARVEPPDEVKNEIKARASDQLKQNLAMAAEAVRLQRSFADAEIPVIFLKGLTLAQLAFGNLGLRHSKDIDLLIFPEDVETASGLLEEAGYRRCEPDPRLGKAQMRSLKRLRKDLVYTNAARGLEIELHWRLFDNPHMMGDVSVASARQAVQIAPDLSLSTLNEEDLFAYLCAHGANDGWFRLKWLADIGAFLGKSSGSQVTHLYRAAAKKGAGPAAAQALLLCQRLFGNELSEPLAKQLRSSVRAQWLERIALWAMLSGDEVIAPPDRPFGRTRISLSHFLLGGGARYAMGEIRILLTSTHDRIMFPLPAWLSFLYPLLRLPLGIYRLLSRRTH